MMTYYFIFAAVVLLIQLLMLLEGYRHYLFSRRKYRPKASKYQPPTAVICPCKGLDTTFDRNINSLFDQDYPHYEIYFVVQSESDPAYRRLEKIIQERTSSGHGVKAHLMVAGMAQSCAQKIHNLLTVCQTLPDEVEVTAFIDSDACLKGHFLGSLIHPLRRKEVGAATGYRWYVPTDKRLSSKVLSVINAWVASLLGPHGWNSAWGGAMAIRRETSEKVNLREAWKNACSDDYLLTNQVKKAGLKISFVPACFVASYEEMSWRELFSFARRQFIITRVYRPQLWYLALFGWGHFVLAFWLGLIVTVLLFIEHSPQAPFAVVLPAGLLAASMAKAVTRQLLIRKILPEDEKKLLAPGLIDIFLGPATAGFALLCVLSAGGKRTIEWRGIKYYLKDENHTQILSSQTEAKSD